MYLPEIEQVVGIQLRLILNWQDGKLVELSLQWADGETSSSNLSAMGKKLEDCLIRYEEGEDVVWPPIEFAFETLTPFARKVLKLLMDVPYGTTISYGELAARAGSPRAARGVGNIMGRNRWGLIIPCHRVVGANGIGGYGGLGVSMKRYLLGIEGVLPKVTEK